MGNAAVAGELASSDELDELRRLDASAGEPQPGDDEPGDDEPGDDEPGDDEPGDDEEEDEGDDDGDIKPEDMPHP